MPSKLLLTFGLILHLSSEGLALSSPVTCPGFENSDHKAPPIIKEIIFVSHKNKHNYNQTMHIEEKTYKPDPNVIYISRLALKVHLNCWAPYPIDLTFEGLSTNLNAQVKTSVSSFRSADNSMKTYCYNINVTLSVIEDSIVGNYSCFEAANSKNRISKYIYLISQPRRALLRHNTNITKIVWPGQKQLSFECAVSDPNVTVSLTKVESDGKTTEITNDATYNPSKGFTLNITDKKMGIEGKYVCKTKLDRLDFVNFDVRRAPKSTFSPVKASLLRKVSNSLNLSCISVEKVFFSFDRDLWKVTPTIQNVTGDEYFESTLWIPSLSSPGTYRISCKFENGTNIQAWNVNVDERGPSTRRLDLNQFKESCNFKEKQKLILFECNNWVECRINRCQDDPSKDKFCQANNHCNTFSCIRNGLIQCPSFPTKGKEPTISSLIYFHGISTNYEYSDTSSLLNPENLNEILNITAYTYSNPSQKNEPGLLLTCLGTNFAVSAGFEWFAIMKQNGSSNDETSYELMSPTGSHPATLKQGLDFAHTVKESYGIPKSTLKSNLYIPKKVLSNPNLLYFQCKAPLWNSTNWVQRNITSADILARWESLEEQHLKFDPLDVNILTRINPPPNDTVKSLTNANKSQANRKVSESSLLVVAVFLVGICPLL